MEVLVVMQRQMPTIQKMQTTVEVPQLQCIDRVVDVPVVMRRQVPIIQRVHKIVEVKQVQVTDKSCPCCGRGKSPWCRRFRRSISTFQTERLRRCHRFSTSIMSWMCWCRCPMIQMVQKTVQIPQVLFIKRIVDVLMVPQ